MQTVEETLKKHSLKVTSFRLDVLELFSSAKFALSLNDIESIIGDHDRITLYRTLKSFEDKGIIHKIVDSNGNQKFAMCEGECSEHNHDDEHVHFHCIQCSHTFCLDHVHIPNIKLPNGYVFKNAQMTVDGLCVNCAVR
jgi:Fur family ferric uptake transcriptional regulator